MKQWISTAHKPRLSEQKERLLIKNTAWGNTATKRYLANTYNNGINTINNKKNNEDINNSKNDGDENYDNKSNERKEKRIATVVMIRTIVYI